MNANTGHSHGRVECEVCHKVVQSCRCMEAGKTVEWVVCPKCKAEKAHQEQQEMSAMNERLRKLGIGGGG